MTPLTLHHEEGFLPAGFHFGALSVNPKTGSPIVATGILSPSLAEVQSASVIVCAPARPDHMMPAKRTVPKRACVIGLVDAFLLDVPLRVLTKSAVRAQEHLSGFLIASELPLQQRERDLAEVSAARLIVSATVADAILPRAERGHFGDALEIVVTVGERDVGRIAGNVEHRRVQLVQLLLGDVLHPRACAGRR